MDNRKYKRVHFARKAFVTSGIQTFKGMTDNISVDGLYLQAQCNFQVGEEVGVVWSQCMGSPVYVDCVVVRNDTRGLAVKFRSVERDSFDMINKIINSHPLALCGANR